MLRFDPSRVTFSHPGSYLALSNLDAPGRDQPPGLYLRTIRGQAKVREMLRIELSRDGQVLPAEISAAPMSLRLEESGGGWAEIAFESPTVLRIRCKDCSLLLSRDDWRPFDHVTPRGRRYLINSYENRIGLMLTPLGGQVEVDAPWERVRCRSMRIRITPDEASTAEIALEEFRRQWNRRDYPASFESCRQACETSWQHWLDRHPVVPGKAEAARELAAYINWSCQVSPSGHFRRPAMLMSKRKMTSLWSWDHCFNAMGCARIDPQLAWDQLMIPFDCIDADGGLPCSITDDLLMTQVAKPPIHGWALGWMMDRCDWIGPEHLRDIREPLEAWTQWWLRFRRDGDQRLPHADHGNDTGWDNATNFHEGLPIISPDIPAYLVLQMHTLARISSLLGDSDSDRKWRSQADAMLSDLLAELWVDGLGFVSRHADGRAVQSGDSLIHFMPLILGHLLEPDHACLLRDRLCRTGAFRTDWGLATESLSSDLYAAEGYWRGPIWAPSTMILIDGLHRAGFQADAHDLAADFLRLCEGNGFPENFSAESGHPLRDPTYTWTASVFLLLLQEYDLSTEVWE